ncbi:MAG TPA: HPr family phosphocarrier protein [Elusimicrobiales bacterium]|nr:HPr family phosphocarrier protein [Elusimicrobiales bacterium]
MTRKDLKVVNTLGIHARPAGMIANTAGRFQSDVKMIKDGMEVNAKSIMGIMTLAAGRNTVITLVASGPDEKEAAAALEDLFNRKFEEE